MTRDGTMTANCTCTLVKGEKNIIVDTMTPWDKQLIIDGKLIALRIFYFTLK